MDLRNLVYTTEHMQGQMHGILADIVLGVRALERTGESKVPEDVASLMHDVERIQKEGTALMGLAGHLSEKIYDVVQKCEQFPNADAQES